VCCISTLGHITYAVLDVHGTHELLVVDDQAASRPHTQPSTRKTRSRPGPLCSTHPLPLLLGVEAVPHLPLLLHLILAVAGHIAIICCRPAQQWQAKQPAEHVTGPGDEWQVTGSTHALCTCPVLPHVASSRLSAGGELLCRSMAYPHLCTVCQCLVAHDGNLRVHTPFSRPPP